MPEQPDLLPLLKRIHLFQNIDEQKLLAATIFMERVHFEQGDIIFKQDDVPDFFYLIESGQVRLSSLPTPAYPNGQLGVFEEDDYFGEEVLESGWQRQVTAQAATEVQLVRTSIPNFIQILRIISSRSFESALQLALDSYRLKLRTHFDWLEKDESIIFIARTDLIVLYQMVLIPTLAVIVGIPAALLLHLTFQLLLTLGFLVFVIAASIGWWIWSYVDWSNDYYVITSSRVVYQERVVLLYESRVESPLSALQSSTVHTSQLGRILGYGNVAIRNLYGTILFRSIKNPQQVMHLVQQIQLRAQFKQRRMDIGKVKDYLTDRLKRGPERPFVPAPRKPAPKPDPMRQFLSTMFHMRYESGGTIIYRTHMFILLTKIWLPSLVLLGLLTLFIMSATNQFAYMSVLATCGLLGLVGFIVVLWWAYQYADWHNDIYLITNDQVVDVYKKPLGEEERQAAPIKNIQSIEYKRLGIIGLLLNFGTVYILVGDRKLTFDNVPRPADVQRELFHALAKTQAKEREQRAEEDKRRLGDWFDAFQQWNKSNPQTPQPPIRSGF